MHKKHVQFKVFDSMYIFYVKATVKERYSKFLQTRTIKMWSLQRIGHKRENNKKRYFGSTIKVGSLNSGPV